jgi:hypothetical protein
LRAYAAEGEAAAGAGGGISLAVPQPLIDDQNFLNVLFRIALEHKIDAFVSHRASRSVIGSRSYSIA